MVRTAWHTVREGELADGTGYLCGFGDVGCNDQHDGLDWLRSHVLAPSSYCLFLDFQQTYTIEKIRRRVSAVVAAADEDRRMKM
jgi:hypothetical protein